MHDSVWLKSPLRGLGAPLIAASLLLGIATPFTLVGCGGGDGKSAAEALATDPNEEFEKSGKYKPNPKPPPPDGPPPPTDEEFKAWDRVDPEGEKHLYKFDKANSKRLLGYWKELVCFREAVKTEGAKAFGTEPMSPESEAWQRFKEGFIPFVNGWQQRLFAKEPRILERSKYIGNILEATELVMTGYPRAYNDGDEIELKKNDAHWLLVEDKMKDYTERIGAKWEVPNPDDPNMDPKEREKWNKFCTEAKKPPKEEKKGK